MSQASVPPESPPLEKMTLPTKLAFGAGDLGTAITANIQVIFQLIFFTNVAGIPAGLAGSILLIGKIWDAINDPVVGMLSDRTQSRWGRRYPWIVAGAIPFGFTFFLMWIVPRFSANDGTNQTLLFWYYVLTGILFNSFYTVVNLPYTAMTPELTRDYDERTSLNSFRFAFSIGGSILSLILAFAIFSVVKDNPTQQYLILGLICGIVSVLPLFWCVFGTWKRSQAIGLLETATDTTDDATPHLSYLEQLKIVLATARFCLSSASISVPGWPCKTRCRSFRSISLTGWGYQISPSHWPLLPCKSQPSPCCLSGAKFQNGWANAPFTLWAWPCGSLPNLVCFLSNLAK